MLPLKYLKNCPIETRKAICVAQAEIEILRERAGKDVAPEYLVINTDEPYAPEIIEILKRNDHWGTSEAGEESHAE